MASIYIHVPFCKSKCTYCDFASFPHEIGKQELYFGCLYKELKGRAHEIKGQEVSTIYFGGGTPSFVDAKYIYGTLKLINLIFKVKSNAEITLEVNPGTIDENKLKVYKNAGINRFSIGLQSACDKTLKDVNRIHTANDFEKAVKLLDGFNLSVDVMIGLPNENFESVKKSIDLAISSPSVKHISLYALKAEEGTPMFSRYLNGDLLSDDEVAEIYQKSVDYLSEKGFFRYEVSNFCKEGYHSKHNVNYWKRGEYLGVGVGASSFINQTRSTNTESIDEYVKLVLSNCVPVVFSENVEEKDAKGEFSMLALRTARGVVFDEYFKEFNSNFLEDFKEAIAQNQKYLEVTDRGVRIKGEYLFVQNSILVHFIN